MDGFQWALVALLVICGVAALVLVIPWLVALLTVISGFA